MSGRPRCVHLLPETHDAGAENQARYLIEELHATGKWDIELIYFTAGRAHEQFAEIGVPLSQVNRRGRFRYDAYGRARRIRSAMRGKEPDLLHCWMLEGNVIGLLAARAWRQTKVVITQRGSWNELDYPSMVRLQRMLIRRADGAISNSSGGARMLQALGMAEDRIEVIANGIPNRRIEGTVDPTEMRARHGWQSKKVLAWVGRISDAQTARQKDVEMLLNAVELLHETEPSVELVMIGATDAELSAAGFRKPTWVTMLGWHPRPAEVLAAADVLVLSSRREGHSNVVGEALMVGLPVVSTDCGDHCELVRASGGRVTAVGDRDALAAAIAELLATPPERQKIRALAADRLDVGRMVEKTEAVYRGLLAAKGSAGRC